MISTPYLLISANTSVTLISQALPLIKSRHLGRLVPVLPMLRIVDQNQCATNLRCQCKQSVSTNPR